MSVGRNGHDGSANASPDPFSWAPRMFDTTEPGQLRFYLVAMGTTARLTPRLTHCSGPRHRPTRMSVGRNGHDGSANASPDPLLRSQTPSVGLPACSTRRNLGSYVFYLVAMGTTVRLTPPLTHCSGPRPLQLGSPHVRHDGTWAVTFFTWSQWARAKPIPTAPANAVRCLTQGQPDPTCACSYDRQCPIFAPDDGKMPAPAGI